MNDLKLPYQFLRLNLIILYVVIKKKELYDNAKNKSVFLLSTMYLAPTLNYDDKKNSEIIQFIKIKLM